MRRGVVIILVLAALALLGARAWAGPHARGVPPVVEDDDGEIDDVPRPAGAPAAPPREPRDLANTAIAMPLPVASVGAAAVRAAGLADDPTPSFRRRARLAGLVPQISARAGRNLTWRDVEDPTLGYTNTYDIRATWHFDRLLFDANEIRISALDVSRRRERRRVEMVAIHTYFEWLSDVSERPELTADLDAMTDGWFSQALAKAAKP